MRLKSRYAAGIAVFATAAVLASGSIAGFKASAQDAAVHPSHIHNGSCAAPGDIIAPLSNTGGTFEVNGTPIPGVTTVGATTAIPVAIGQTVVSFALSDLVSAPHSIVVHESAANIQNYIACGDLGGAQLDASNLSIGLGPLNNSGFHGVAWLHDNGNGTTLVTVFLLSPDQGSSAATTSPEATAPAASPEATTPAASPEIASPVASPAASPVAANTVEIKDFAYAPASLEVTAGTTVTWTNNDTTAHTVSQNGGGFESGKLDPGKTFSFTFATPGTYEYFCQFHANMHGTIVVK